MKKSYILIVLLSSISLVQAQAPTITSFSPLKGIPGRLVTINGTNFSKIKNIVYFGTTRGIVISSTNIQITVLAPVGSIYSQISVYNTETYLYGYSQKYFTPTFAPKNNTITASDFLSKVDFSAYSKPTSIAVADFASSYRPNIAVANDNIVYHSGLTVYYGSTLPNNSITGTIDSSSIGAPEEYTLASNRPQAIAVGDVLQSGSLGSIYACYGSNTVYSVGEYYSVGYGPNDVTMSDLDVDGKPDIITANALSFSVSILPNTNTAPQTISFASAINIITGFQPKAVAAGDINGDGLPDLIIANANNDTTLGLTILKNKSTPGNISFAPQVNFTTGLGATDVAVADIDGDDLPDVIVVNQKSNTISVYRNTGKAGNITSASLDQKVDFTTGNKPKAIAVGDINGDGKVDIAVTNLKSNDISIFQNTATSGVINANSLAAQIAISVGNNSQPYDVAVHDIDGDGRPDITVAEYGLASIAIIKNEPSVNNFNIIGQTMDERSLQYAKANSKKSNSFNATIFPNPAKDYVVLKTNDLHTKTSIRLTNTAGNTIWQKTNTQDNFTTIPLSGLPAGLYFIQLNDMINSATLKLIKQ